MAVLPATRAFLCFEKSFSDCLSSAVDDLIYCVQKQTKTPDGETKEEINMKKMMSMIKAKKARPATAVPAAAMTMSMAAPMVASAHSAFDEPQGRLIDTYVYYRKGMSIENLLRL